MYRIDSGSSLKLRQACIYISSLMCEHYQHINYSLNVSLQGEDWVLNETQKAAHWGNLEKNGSVTGVASQLMTAPGPPEAWDTGKCKWGKSIDGETSFFSSAARP